MRSRKPRLLILTSSFPRGPRDETCGYIRDFARSLSPQFEIQVLAPADKDAVVWPPDDFTLYRSKSFLPASLDPLQASADLNRLISGNLLALAAMGLSLLSFFLTAFRLARRADVLCSHWLLPSGLIGASLSRLLAKPHVIVEHSGALHLLARMRGGRSLARFIIGGSRKVITVSRDLKAKLLALCPDAANKIEVMPMGIPCRGRACPCPDGAQHHEASSPNGDPGSHKGCPYIYATVLFVGRLTPIKGVDVLLRAARHLEGARLLIAGDGESRHELETLARELSVKATFLGRIDAAQREQLFSSCDVAVIPSVALPNGRAEGMPVVCLEAMAAGLPVIAARVGGLAEVIVDGRNGLLFEPGDEQALAERLHRLLADRNLREALAANARRTAEGYAWPQIGPRFAGIIYHSMGSDGDLHSQRINARAANS